MRAQRYVSDELTHLAGSGKSEEKQYEILLEILGSGTLLASRGGLLEGPVPPPPGTGGGLIISPNRPLDEMFTARVVCFCDIPIPDLEFHARKYSYFGLAFTKVFLLRQGANPVFYVAETELTEPRSSIVADAFPEARTRIELSKAGLSRLQMLFAELLYGRGPLGGPRTEEWAKDDADVMTIQALQSFLGWYIGCFIKPFDPLTKEDDLENYYMEREWRVVNNVHFSLDDVARVFVPKAYTGRLRADLPEYHGQIQELVRSREGRAAS